MFVDIVKFVVAVQNWFVRCGCCSVIDFYNGSYQEGVKIFKVCHPEVFNTYINI